MDMAFVFEKSLARRRARRVLKNLKKEKKVALTLRNALKSTNCSEMVNGRRHRRNSPPVRAAKRDATARRPLRRPKRATAASSSCRRAAADCDRSLFLTKLKKTQNSKRRRRRRFIVLKKRRRRERHLFGVTGRLRSQRLGRRSSPSQRPRALCSRAVHRAPRGSAAPKSATGRARSCVVHFHQAVRFGLSPTLALSS